MLCSIFRLSCNQIGDKDYIVDLVLLHKLLDTKRVVLAVIHDIDCVIVLGQEGSEAVAEGIFNDQAGAGIGDAVVDDLHQGVVGTQECKVLVELVASGLVVNQLGFHRVGISFVEDISGDIALGNVCINIILSQLILTGRLGIQRAQELALIPLFEIFQRRCFHTQGLADGGVGVICATGSPVVVGTEEQVFTVVLDQGGVGIHSNHIFTHGIMQGVNDHILVSASQFFQIFGLDHDTHRSRGRGTDQTATGFCQIVAQLAQCFGIASADIFGEAQGIECSVKLYQKPIILRLLERLFWVPKD